MERFNKGQVKKTEGQTKWLFNELDPKKQAYCTSLAKQLDYTTKLHKHVLNKVHYEHLELDKVLLQSMLRGNYEIIEFNLTRGQERVLLRSSECTKHTIGSREAYVNLCLSYQPSTNEIRTIYYNYVNDNHATLDMKRYK